MSALREIFARFGVDFQTEGLEKGNAGVNALTDRLRGLGEALAGGAVVLGIRAFVEEMAHAGDELHNTSIALGLNTEQLQQWRAAAGQAGVAAEQLTPAIQAVRRNADAARIAGGQMARDFRALHVTVRDGHGGLRDTDEILRDMADGFQQIDDPGRRAAIAMRLMGEQGARLLPMLEQGSAGVDEAAAAFEALGGGMSEEAIEAAREYTAQTRALDAALLGLKSRISVYVLPFVGRLVEGMTRAAAALSWAADKGRLLEATAVALGVAMAAAGARSLAAWLMAAAPFVALAAAIGVAILVVEDLVVGLEGGRSALGAWGEDFDEWLESATGALEPVAGLLMAIRDTIRVIVNEAADMFGFGDDFLGLYQAEPPTQAQQQERLAAARRQGEAIRAQREAEARTRAQGGIVFRTGEGPALDLPAFAGSTGTAAAGGVLGSLGGAPTRGAPAAPVIQNSIGRLEVRTEGMTPAQAQRMVTSAVQDAFRSQSEDTLDTLTTGD